MSHIPEQRSSYSLGGIISSAFYIGFASMLIVMLGYVGVALIGGGGHRPSPVQVAAAASVASVPPGTASAAAATPSAPAASLDPAQMQAGKEAYVLCSACHGPDGNGMMAGPLKMAPTLVGSKILNGNPEAAIAALLKGIKKETADYVQIMVPLPLDDEKIAAVLTYARNSFGNSAPPVDKDLVSQIRAKMAASTEAMARAELEAIAVAK